MGWMRSKHIQVTHTSLVSDMSQSQNKSALDKSAVLKHLAQSRTPCRGLHELARPFPMAPPEGLTDAQAAVYDRQLRLWGHEVQKRLTDAKVLILGGDGLAAEIAKNLVLAGVGHVALADSTPVAQAAFGNFLVPADASPTSTVAQASVHTLTAMNPLITVDVASIATPTSSSQPWDVQPGDLAPYDLIISTYGLSHTMSDRLETLCAEQGKHLYVGQVIGSLAYAFLYLGSKFTYAPKQPEGTPKDAAAQKLQEISFPRLEAALSRPASQCLGRRPIHPLYQVLRVVRSFESKHGREPSMEADIDTLQNIAKDLEASEGVPEGSLSRDLLASWVLDRGEAGQLAAAPVSSVAGGVLANAAVRAISRVGAPLKNWFFFTLADGAGVVEDIGGP